MRALSLSLLLALFATSNACVSTHMKKYIGRDARYIQTEDGPPVNVFDLPDGRRAFQYFWGGGTYRVPQTTSTAGQVQLVGDSVYYAEQKIESGGQVIQSEGCRITYLAKWDPTQKGWIVTEISYPKRLVC
jgi:hypothetical protein